MMFVDVDDALKSAMVDPFLRYKQNNHSKRYEENTTWQTQQNGENSIASTSRLAKQKTLTLQEHQYP